MKKQIEGKLVPLKMWLTDIEEGCLQQAMILTELPFLHSHVALMPDAHFGMGMPIGGVIAAKETVIPNAVGVDIGCGMCAVRTNLKADQVSRKDLQKLMQMIRSSIPLGFEHRKKPVSEEHLPKGHPINKLPVVKSQAESIPYQIGTLGGGNHFIEIQKSDKGEVWVMIHSGSRNLGHRVASHYNKLAEQYNDKMKLKRLPQLAYLPLETEEAKNYIAEMEYCIDFAFANRSYMMEEMKRMIRELFPGVRYDKMINIAHNYAAREKHFGENVIVHRKGATRAFKGEVGIIPGSMGSKSYIVEGLGNPESFMSCSHGAGRVMGRKEAQRRLDLNYEIARLDNQGIVHGMRSKSHLDEAVSAYKNIDEVMANQADLVRPLVELFPMAVMKA